MCLFIVVFVRIIYGPPSFIFKMINGITFLVFAYDKYQGLQKGWRVAENGLFLLSLLGGWIGGICAMIVLRHKTYKSSFLITMGIIALINIVVVSNLSSAFKR